MENILTNVKALNSVVGGMITKQEEFQKTYGELSGENHEMLKKMEKK
jgi:hypothetical protein